MKLMLAPIPQSVDMTGGWHALPREKSIVLHGEAAVAGALAARRFQSALERYTGAVWEIRAAPGLANREALVATIDHSAVEQREGYHLTVGEERIGIVAHDAPGLAYAFATLTQLVRQFGRRLPRLHIEDAPRFARRGVMLDISRDKVPTMETLYGLVDMLAEWKINEFQLYMEHTFAYEQHRTVWKDASPMTGEELLALDAYCRERHIDLVPNQNSFGHMARWLTKRPYRDLAESPGGMVLPWGKIPPFTLDPCDERSLELIDGLYAELLPHFTSTLFNVGCDETFDLGHGKSRDTCAQRGTGRVYLDFLLEIHKLCQKYGRRMMFWGDIILQYPDLIREVPRDVVVLEWGYEHDHPYDIDTKQFRSARLPFYVCPGAGGWMSLLGRTDNVVANVRSATTNGHAAGARGVLNTEWGDNGHMQPLPVSALGFLYGAAMSWSPGASSGIDLAGALSLHAFDDPSGITGRIAYDLGNAYQVWGGRTRNGSLLAQIYFLPVESDWPLHRARPGGFEDSSEFLGEKIAQLDPSRMRRDDADLIVEEYRCAVEMADIGAAIGAAKYSRANGGRRGGVRQAFRRAAKRLDAIAPEYERLWLQRNRPGGLSDSSDRLHSLAQSLRDASE